MPPKGESKAVFMWEISSKRSLELSGSDCSLPINQDPLPSNAGDQAASKHAFVRLPEMELTMELPLHSPPLLKRQRL